MKKNVVIIPLVFLAILQYGCSYRYGIANGGMESRVLPKPDFEGELIEENYISGQYYAALNSGFKSDESYHFGDVFISRGISDEIINYAYGAGLFLGKYYVNHENEAPGWKSFGGLGATSEFSVSVRYYNFMIDIWGIRATLSYDFGSYPNFRKEIEKKYHTYNMHTNNFSVNLSSPINVEYRIKNSKIGLYSIYGFTFGNSFWDGYLTLSIALTYNYKLFSLNAQATNCLILNQINSNFPVFSMGIACHL